MTKEPKCWMCEAGFPKHLIGESQKKITLRYQTCDKVNKIGIFKVLEDAQEFAHKWMGQHPNLKDKINFAESFDGVATMTVEGATLDEIFPDESKFSNEGPDNRQIN